MNWLDVFFLLILAGSVIEGIRSGFSRVAIGLVSAIVGLIMAAWFYGAAATFLKPFIASEAVANIAAFLLIFLGVQMAGAILGWICSKVFHWTGLGWLDRLLGAAAGAASAAFTAVVLVLVFSAFHFKPLESALAGSRAAPYLLDAAQVIVYPCPRALRDDFAEARDRLLDLWRKSVPARKPPASSA